LKLLRRPGSHRKLNIHFVAGKGGVRNEVVVPGSVISGKLKERLRNILIKSEKHHVADPLWVDRVQFEYQQ